jgi:hypothetical protein
MEIRILTSCSVHSRGLDDFIANHMICRKPMMGSNLGEQVSIGGSELHVNAGFVQPKPATGNRLHVSIWVLPSCMSQWKSHQRNHANITHSPKFNATSHAHNFAREKRISGKAMVLKAPSQSEYHSGSSIGGQAAEYSQGGSSMHHDCRDREASPVRRRIVRGAAVAADHNDVVSRTFAVPSPSSGPVPLRRALRRDPPDRSTGAPGELWG